METFNDQHIEDYLLGRLSPEDAAALQKAATTDAALQKQIKEQQAIIDQVEHLGAYKMKNKLDGVGKRFHERRAKKGRSRRIFLIASAAAAAVFLFFTTQFFLQETNSPQQLYAQHFKTYPLPFNTRSTDQDKKLIDAGTFYRKGDFKSAIPILNDLVDETPDDSRLFLALGISHLEAAQPDLAIQALAPLIERKDTLYLAQAHWYTALSYLQKNNISACQKELNWLSQQPDAFNKKEAQELLDALE